MKMLEITKYFFADIFPPQGNDFTIEYEIFASQV